MDNFDYKKYLAEGFLDHPSERESKRDFEKQFPKSKGSAGEPGVTASSRSQDFGHPDDIISVVDDMTLTMGEDAFISAIFKALSLEDAKRILKGITKDNPIDNELGPVTYDWLNEDKLNENIFGKYATRKAPKDTADENNPDYDLYMGNDDPEYRKFYMALKRLIEKSNKNLDKNFEILGWIENLLNHIKPEK